MRNRLAIDKIIELYSCINPESSVKAVAPPSQTANGAIQKQLVLNTNAIMLPKKDFL